MRHRGSQETASRRFPSCCRREAGLSRDASVQATRAVSETRPDRRATLGVSLAECPGMFPGKNQRFFWRGTSFRRSLFPSSRRPLAAIGDRETIRAPAHSTTEQRMSRQDRYTQETTLQDKLIAFAKDTREKASLLPPGLERRDLLRKAGQADTAADLDGWLNSPGLQPPK